MLRVPPPRQRHALIEKTVEIKDERSCERVEHHTLRISRARERNRRAREDQGRHGDETECERDVHDAQDEDAAFALRARQREK